MRQQSHLTNPPLGLHVRVRRRRHDDLHDRAHEQRTALLAEHDQCFEDDRRGVQVGDGREVDDRVGAADGLGLTSTLSVVTIVRLVGPIG